MEAVQELTVEVSKLSKGWAQLIIVNVHYKTVNVQWYVHYNILLSTTPFWNILKFYT